MADKSERCNTICSKLADFRREGVLCDATVVIGNDVIPVHKCVLTASSSYFRAMFTGSFAEKKQGSVRMQGLTSDTFHIILNYTYGADIDMTLKNVRDLFAAADMLCLDELAAECRTYFESNWSEESDLVEAYETAETLELRCITREIILKAKSDLAGFLKSNDVCKLPFSFWLSVLDFGSDGVQFDTASLVLQHVMKWTFFKPDERLPDVWDLLTLLPFELVTPSSINEILGYISSYVESVVTDELSYFTECLEDLYRNTCKRMIDQRVNLIFLRYNISLKISILNTEDWLWTRLTCKVSSEPESYLLREDDLYIFTDKGCTILNLRNQKAFELPAFPERRKRSAFSVLDNTVYVLGGIREYTGEPLCDMLELSDTSATWIRRITWTGPICDARSVTFSNSIFYVGWKDAHKKSSCNRSCFVYNSITKCLKQIGKLLTCDCNLKFAFYDEVLYIFSENFRIVEAVDIHNEKLLPWTEINILEHSYRILDVCAVEEGILIAYVFQDTVLLGLFKPSKERSGSVRLLGFVPQVNPWEDENRNRDWVSPGEPTVFIQKRDELRTKF